MKNKANYKKMYDVVILKDVLRLAQDDKRTFKNKINKYVFLKKDGLVANGAEYSFLHIKLPTSKAKSDSLEAFNYPKEGIYLYRIFKNVRYLSLLNWIII